VAELAERRVGGVATRKRWSRRESNPASRVRFPPKPVELRVFKSVARQIAATRGKIRNPRATRFRCSEKASGACPEETRSGRGCAARALGPSGSAANCLRPVDRRVATETKARWPEGRRPRDRRDLGSLDRDLEPREYPQAPEAAVTQADAGKARTAHWAVGQGQHRLSTGGHDGEQSMPVRACPCGGVDVEEGGVGGTACLVLEGQWGRQ
jgi:hypothetical protein